MRVITRQMFLENPKKCINMFPKETEELIKLCMNDKPQFRGFHEFIFNGQKDEDRYYFEWDMYFMRLNQTVLEVYKKIKWKKKSLKKK